MKKKGKVLIISGIALLIIFLLWTKLIQEVDVQSIGVNGTEVGLSVLNSWFKSIIGVNMTLYNVTDWLGLVPVFICLSFAVVGFSQLIKRRNILKVDFDIIVSGVYYVIVVLCYLLFEMNPINYRPILIDGFLEASYPSSTTLLALSVMPTLIFLSGRRLNSTKIKKFITVVTGIFTAFMVIGRLFSGVHWITDIIGSILLSTGLFCIYIAVIVLKDTYNS